jgi:hypothetical protein
VAESSEDIFTLLESESVGAAVRVRYTDIELDAGKVAHGLHPVGDRRHLYVPLADGQPAVEDRTSRGVSITEQTLEENGRRRRYLDIACEVAELRDLFAVLCDEMLEAIASRRTEPAVACRNVLDRWRELLSPAPSRLLGRETLAGLLAELHFMELIAARDPERACALWTGPDRGRFDYTSGDAAVEVKATMSRERLTVQIHGIGQLEPVDGRVVRLFVEQLEPVPAGGDSVPDAVNRLGSAGVDMHALVTGLAAVGYSMSDAVVYRKIRFEVRSRRAFRTDTDGFPKLVPSGLIDPGVLNRITLVRYTVDLTGLGASSGALPGPADCVDALLGPAS